MTPHNKEATINITNEVGRTVTIRRTGECDWHVTQRSHGPGQDDCQNVTWLKIENSGPPSPIRIKLRWAEFAHMSQRQLAYLRCGKRYQLVRG